MRHEFWIDRGGTFTDCILFDRTTGKRRVAKVLSSDEAPLVGIRTLLGLDESEPIPPCDVRMGTTVATNALLERKGARTALVITQGFADLLEIGDQTRPELFSLNIKKPEQLYSAVLTTSARLSPQGEKLAWPTDDEVQSLAKRLAQTGATSVAVVVCHAYANPQLEEELVRSLAAAWPADSPLPSFTCSTDSACEQGLLARSSTAVLDAYITPLLRNYLDELGDGLRSSTIRLMQSSGGLASALRFRGPEAILSGPAGGLVAGERIARELGSERVVTFDMGGTSTDVSLIEGAALLRYETTISGVFLRAPMLDIHTIAAGGGSECSFDGYGLKVGPESVGADPGPLCYGSQRPENAPRVALTDVNLLLGRLAGDHFSFPLNVEASVAGLADLAAQVTRQTGTANSTEDVARGLAVIATANMAEAIRTVTVEKGVDLSTVDLLVFGGAAGQHACAIATTLGIQRIVVHRLSGVLSAYGIGHADEVWSGESDAGRVKLGRESERALVRQFVALEEKGREALTTELTRNAEGRNAPIQVRRSVALRYRGTESTLTLRWASPLHTLDNFHAEHQKRFGFNRPTAAVEIVSARAEIRILSPCTDENTGSTPSLREMPQPKRTTRVILDERIADEVPVYELDSLVGAPRPVRGPALLLEPTGTILIEDNYQAQISGDLLLITRSRSAQSDALRPKKNLDQIARAPIMATRFAAIAEQMGEALRRSASSTNIRDRLDYSCAVFDRTGALVANAPHIPVHLGAMSESVAAVLRAHPQMSPGDSYVTNDPALGGSHLPDITVITPLFDQKHGLIAFTASRGHHADVGGTEPGSMPAFSRTLSEEGIVLSALKLVENGELLERKLRLVLASPPHPARNPDENLADLKAQLSANQLGATLLLKLVNELGDERVASDMATVRQISAQWMRDAISTLPDTPLEFSDQLDDGSVIKVRITKEPERLLIDFAGSSPESECNLNAPRAVTVACVLYSLRVFLNRPLPLNQGCLDPVEILIPQPSILAPSPERAVAGGNVETSQRIVDVILGALGLAAASQGTMNNLSFGDESFGYYETIAGGAGAGPEFDGADAVHTHMTNTRITDPEILEDRFPVRVTEFSIRRGSGGAGRHNGGAGIVREIEALSTLRLSLLTERRTRAPFGLQGGVAGQMGKNTVAKVDVGSRYTGTLEPGQSVRVETPGGGGFGKPQS